MATTQQTAAQQQKSLDAQQMPATAASSADLNDYYKSLIKTAATKATKAQYQKEYAAWKKSYKAPAASSAGVGSNAAMQSALKTANSQIATFTKDYATEAAKLKTQLKADLKGAKGTAAKKAVKQAYADSIATLQSTYADNVNKPITTLSGAQTKISTTLPDTVKQYIEQTGNIPTDIVNNSKSNWDLYSAAVKYRQDYEDKKAKDAAAAANKVNYSTATDLAGATEDAKKGLLVDRTKNPDLWKQTVQQIAGGTPSPAPPPTPPAPQPQAQPQGQSMQDLAAYIMGQQGAPATTPAPTGGGADGMLQLAMLLGMAPPPQYNPQSTQPAGNVNLPQDYAARNAVQDQMVANQSNAQQMNDLQRAQVQNANIARQLIAPPPRVYAAGGYLDSKMQGGLGTGGIHNVTPYANYSYNPGVTSNYNTSQGDDGSVGGVAVPDQTNPLW